MENQFKLSWIDILIAILCFIIAVVYGGLMATELVNGNAASIQMNNEQLIVDRAAFLGQTRDLFITIIALLGGIKIIQRKSFGWSAAVFVTLMILTLSVAFLTQMISDKSLDPYLAGAIAAVLFSLFLAIYLWLPATRIKWQVKAGNYVLALIMTGMVTLLVLS